MQSRFTLPLKLSTLQIAGYQQYETTSSTGFRNVMVFQAKILIMCYFSYVSSHWIYDTSRTSID